MYVYVYTRMWKKTISVNTAHNFVREKSQYFSVTSCCALQWSHAPQYERRHMLTDQISFNFVYFTFSLPRPLSSSLLLCEVKCRATSAAIELLAARGEGKGGKLSPNLAIVSANRWNRARNFVLLLLFLLLLLLLSRLALDLWPNNLNNFILYICGINDNCFACHFVASCCCRCWCACACFTDTDSR